MSITSYLTGLTPEQLDGVTPPTGATANGQSVNITGASLAATELPKAAVGTSVPQADGTNVTPSRYAKKLLLQAVGVGICIKFGTAAGVAAATAADHCIMAGHAQLYTRPKGVTHYRAISEDGVTAGRLKISVMEWEGEGAN